MMGWTYNNLGSDDRYIIKLAVLSFLSCSILVKPTIERNAYAVEETSGFHRYSLQGVCYAL
jgi:hypothetical protein